MGDRKLLILHPKQAEKLKELGIESYEELGHQILHADAERLTEIFRALDVGLVEEEDTK